MARSSPALSRSSASEPPLPREAAVVRGHRALAQPLRRARGRPAPPAGGCSRRRWSSGARGPAPRSGRRSPPRARWRRPTRAARRGPRPRGRAAAIRSTSMRAQRGRPPGSTRAAPTRNRATSSSGSTVAERPMRCGRRRASASSRSSDSARCAPRLSRASAWISSTITVSTAASSARPRSAVRSRYSDSGVVTSTCGGRRTMAWRRLLVVSPVRTATRRAGGAEPLRRPRRRRAPGAARAGSARRRWRAPGAARRRGPGWRRAAPRPGRRAAAGRGPRGRRPGSCRNRSGPTPARPRRPRWQARRGPGAPSAPRSCSSNQRRVTGWKVSSTRGSDSARRGNAPRALRERGASRSPRLGDPPSAPSLGPSLRAGRYWCVSVPCMQADTASPASSGSGCRRRVLPSQGWRVLEGGVVSTWWWAPSGS